MFARPLIAAGAAVLLAASAKANMLEYRGFRLSADVRLRTETDWDSETASGVERPDRTRFRTRLRARVDYKPNAWLDFTLRARTGSDDSQQSPHITIHDFDGNPEGDADFLPDLYQARVRHGGFEAVGGRTVLPFFKQNELFWHDDVTLLGGAVRQTLGFAGGDLTLAAGGFKLPVGMWDYAGTLYAGQMLYSRRAGHVDFKAAAGLFALVADASDPDAGRLLEGNGARDYSIVVTNLKAAFPFGGRPVALGVDLFVNIESYGDDPDPFTRANKDETTGYAFSAFYGDLKAGRHWLAGYTYAHIEQFSVNNSFAQDDWVRFGSGGQTRASNIKGHELRLGYAITPRMNLLARLYLVKAITTREDGNRFRLDWNWTF